MKKIMLHEIDQKEFSNYAGKVVALDFDLDSILASADDLDKLEKIMIEKYPPINYIPYGVPTFIKNNY